MADNESVPTMETLLAEVAAAEIVPVLAEISDEVVRAELKHPPLNSAHEAYAVILEELDGFKAEVWKQTALRDKAAMRTELIQIAAMAVRTIRNLHLQAKDER